MVLRGANVVLLNSVERETETAQEEKQRAYNMQTAAYQAMGLLRHKNDGLAQEDHRVAIKELCGVSTY